MPASPADPSLPHSQDSLTASLYGPSLPGLIGRPSGWTYVDSIQFLIKMLIKHTNDKKKWRFFLNVRELVRASRKDVRMWESGPATKQGQRQWLKGIIRTSAMMLCRALVARWSNQGWERSLVRLTLPLEAGPESKSRLFPREDSCPQGRRRPGNRLHRALLCFRSLAPSIFLTASPSHSMSNCTLQGLSELWEYLAVGCQRCLWIWLQ